MRVYVVNLDDRPDRWQIMQQRLGEYGYDPIRWPATRHDTPYVGVLRSYRRLLRHLAATDGDGWVVLQDDIIIAGPLEREFPLPIHLYGGYLIRRGGHPVIADPLTSAHVCPQAFHLTRQAIPPLLAAWSNEHQRSCETWTSYLGLNTATFDTPPTAYPDNPSRPSTA